MGAIVVAQWSGAEVGSPGEVRIRSRLPNWVRTARDTTDEVARHAPARLALFTFAGVVAIVAALLLTPFATADGRRAPFVDALFTAVSAVSVTGLSTVETGSYWSTSGQVVILVGIAIGGLAVMTLAALLGLAVSRRLGLTERMLAATESRTPRLGEVGSLLRVVVIASTAVEGAIAAVLFPRFLALGESTGNALWHSVFYGVSAFNNAGFAPTTEGLPVHLGDWWVAAPIALGALIGSVGFPAILDLGRHPRSPRFWSLHTKLTLAASFAVLGGGALVIGIGEWNNPATLGSQSLPSKVLSTLFVSVNARSGGFSTIPVGGMHEPTWLITDALMFVGGGSASTAGGIKVTTLAVMLLAIVAEARGHRDIEAFHRRIPKGMLRIAVAVTLASATIVLLGTMLLLAITGRRLDEVLFEVISAFSTCGLSTGITPDLPDAGKYLLSVIMFVGRTGSMTLAAALALRDRRRVIRQPEERLLIG